jgi:GNAT superfamily N-acetyltransferase
MDSVKYKIITPASCENYRQMVAPLSEACWPEIMLHDPVANDHWSALFERFPEYQFGMLDTQNQHVAAMANSVPLQWNRDLNLLPDRGWDWAFEKAVHDHAQGLTPDIQCAIQIAIHPDYQGQGLSHHMLQTMRSIGKAKGFHQLIAPVRPNQKSQYPLIDIDHYIAWKTSEGLPFDPWIRVHTRIGGRIIRACRQSMIIRGNLAEWESWTGLKFPETAAFIIPGALNPVEMDLEKDVGTYYEPNVWIVHKLA